ncbi:lantibiotic dehydratase [Streptomyces macrosporus]|uniref:Lantibiotic dehydratase N-terminal domain-containing protein n=1 Tax=Streptomyces macrosporus TaxID=44032 RepID=A0ABP5XP91_9ACTN
MPSSRMTPAGVALLRAAVMPLDSVPDQWPDPSDTPACRAWLAQVWDRSEFAAAVRQASPDLAARVDAIRAGRATSDKHVRRAVVSITRYLLRATGRPTPFGLFAGVARAGLAPAAAVRWGTEHRAVARPDTQWLAAVLDRLEACPDLLERLDVVFSNLAVQRGGRLHLPHGPNRVTIVYSAPSTRPPPSRSGSRPWPTSSPPTSGRASIGRRCGGCSPN